LALLLLLARRTPIDDAPHVAEELAALRQRGRSERRLCRIPGSRRAAVLGRRLEKGLRDEIEAPKAEGGRSSRAWPSEMRGAGT
jgi:hypothetical protein